MPVINLMLIFGTCAACIGFGYLLGRYHVEDYVQIATERDRYRKALEQLMEFGKRLMASEVMEDRGIGCCICEGARVVEDA